jgi:NitT/TauT family transport system substrate-binding protein
MITMVAGLLLVLNAVPASAESPIRVGFFANMTHGQALIGKGRGEFEKKTGRKIDWKVFNAGPAAMEAMMAGALDIAYVGPNPAINAYFRSGGKSLRIVAGAASGGAGLVTLRESKIKTPKDFRNRKVASPEFGNTQDVALRSWLKSQQLSPGRDVKVLPMKNPDILMMFQQKKIDAAWVPEPWFTRLLQEGGGELFLDERTLWKNGRFTTAVVVVNADFLVKNRDLVKKFLAAHVEITEAARREPAKARSDFNMEFAAITRKPLPEKELVEIFNRLQLTYDPITSSLVESAGRAAGLGFLPPAARDGGSVAQACDLKLLNEVLKERGLPSVK